jgi:hypothetical protein
MGCAASPARVMRPRPRVDPGSIQRSVILLRLRVSGGVLSITRSMLRGAGREGAGGRGF